MNEHKDVEALRQKYGELLKDYREVTGQDLSVEARQVLNTLDSARDFVSPEAVAPAISVSVQRAVFLLERLAESGHVLPSGSCPTAYRIMQKGRMAVHGTSA